MSDNNVRWEPVEQGRHYMANGERVDVGEDFVSVDDCQGGESSMWLPPDIRLCRAVPVTWSQEPPDAPGQQWMWRSRWRQFDPNARPECRMVYYGGDNDVGELGFDHRLLGFVTIEDALKKWPDTWYMPAVVPQPPTGEVGE